MHTNPSFSCAWNYANGQYFAFLRRHPAQDEANRFIRWEERRTIHEQRLPHRSVHVLLFDGAGRAKVGDFGLAARSEEPTDERTASSPDAE